MRDVVLPDDHGRLVTYRIRGDSPYPEKRAGPFNRKAIAAAHVVADPFADISSFEEVALDWEATIAYRARLWRLGFGVAEAMDTAQRGAGLDWPLCRELIARTLEAARDHPGAETVCGVNTDQLGEGPHSLDAIVRAYLEQGEFVAARGGRPVIMSSRALAVAARTPADYRAVYRRVLQGLDGPVILHWLGPAFDPSLAGYWGSHDARAAMDTCLALICDHADRIDGIKLSLLDADLEKRMRAALPSGVRLYTGDDFNFPELIAGDGAHHSDALLGIFDPIAPAASAALSALSNGDPGRFHEILAPTRDLGRHVFAAPTRFYKTGVVFLAYINGFQDHFVMPLGHQAARSTRHLARVLKLADDAGLIRDAERAAHRARHFFNACGVPY